MSNRLIMTFLYTFLVVAVTAVYMVLFGHIDRSMLITATIYGGFGFWNGWDRA